MKRSIVLCFLLASCGGGTTEKVERANELCENNQGAERYSFDYIIADEFVAFCNDGLRIVERHDPARNTK